MMRQEDTLVAAARASVGRPNSEFWPANPRRACAAFVSTMLQQVGRLDRVIPSCRALMTRLERDGAREALAPARGGDVIFFYDRGGKLRHVEIASSPSHTIGTSSREGVVGERLISRRGFCFSRVWRLQG